MLIWLVAGVTDLRKGLDSLAALVQDASGSELQFPARYGQNDCVIALGRRVWLFCDTQLGAQASANLYSIVGSARANGIEPHAYLTHLYMQLPRASTVEHLEALLPWNFTPRRRALAT